MSPVERPVDQERLTCTLGALSHCELTGGEIAVAIQLQPHGHALTQDFVETGKAGDGPEVLGRASLLYLWEESGEADIEAGIDAGRIVQCLEQERDHELLPEHGEVLEPEVIHTVIPTAFPVGQVHYQTFDTGRIQLGPARNRASLLNALQEIMPFRILGLVVRLLVPELRPKVDLLLCIATIRSTGQREENQMKSRIELF